MASEEKRILKMFYQLCQTEGYIKASELALAMSVSERTIKGDIERLKEYVKSAGCDLASVRGKGYCLKVKDPTAYQKAREQMGILFANDDIDSGKREKQVYRIARMIMHQEEDGEWKWFRLEDLADTLFLSFSSLKKEMRNVRTFLESFQLKLISKPGYGMRLSGDELNYRFCLIELYENHFHKRVVIFQDEMFERKFEDRGDKAQIRKTVLDIIRQSAIEIYDSYANRLIDYILLLRNRVKSGCIVGNENPKWPVWKQEIQKTEEYVLAQDFVRALTTFADFEFPENETTGLALLLLLWEDWGIERDIETVFPETYKEAADLTETVARELKKRWLFDINRDELQLEKKMIFGLFRILIHLHYDYAQCRMIGSIVSDFSIKSSLVSLTLADEIAQVVERQYDCEINECCRQILATRLYGCMENIEYRYVPRKLFICSRDGKHGAEVIESAIRRKLGDWWIGRVTLGGLYEGRKYQPEEFDFVIGCFGVYAYRYVWPYIEVRQVCCADDIAKIQREVLLSGYDLTGAAESLSLSEVSVHQKFAGNSIGNILQILAYQWGKDRDAKERLAEFFAAEWNPRVYNQVLLVMIPACYTDQSVLELYQLKRTLVLDGESVRAVLFGAVDFRGGTAGLKFMEQAVRCLASDYEQWESLLTSETLMKSMTESVRKTL